MNAGQIASVRPRSLGPFAAGHAVARARWTARTAATGRASTGAIGSRCLAGEAVGHEDDYDEDEDNANDGDGKRSTKRRRDGGAGVQWTRIVSNRTPPEHHSKYMSGDGVRVTYVRVHVREPRCVYYRSVFSLCRATCGCLAAWLPGDDAGPTGTIGTFDAHPVARHPIGPCPTTRWSPARPGLRLPRSVGRSVGIFVATIR